MTFKPGDIVRYAGRNSKDGLEWVQLKVGQTYTFDRYVSPESYGEKYIRLREFLEKFPNHAQDAVDFVLVKSADEAKPTNPKQAYGDKKPPIHLIHAIAKLHESAALHSGKRKYGENNYLQSQVEAMTYVGAMLRHIDQWVSGERVDRKELVHHLGAVRACAGILLAAEACNTLIDNRPCRGVQAMPPAATDSTYQFATEAAFKEVEGIIEHLNSLYPPKAD